MDLRSAFNSFFRLSEVLDSLKLAATGDIDVNAFQQKVEAHLAAFKVAWKQ